MESTILLFTNVCVSEITAINMSLTKEDIIKGLKEVTRKLEEGDEIDSSTMGKVLLRTRSCGRTKSLFLKKART